MTAQMTSQPWWRTRRWQNALRDLLLLRGRRRFSLILSDQAALGATDFQRRTVEVNPVQVAYPPAPADRRLVRSAPSDALAWEQQMATALVEHESGHICHSGSKPAATQLGWLWNALEDERQERLQQLANPDLEQLFQFLGDAIWRENAPTADLLASCLLWRWEHDRPVSQRRFRPAPADQARWDQEVRPLVERAWGAATSDEVTELAQQILQILGLPEDAPLPPTLPFSGCVGVSGQRGPGDAPDGSPVSRQPAPLPDGVQRPSGGGVGQGGSAPNRNEADPAPLLAQVEGFARDLAWALRPPTPNQWPRPHRSRGTLVLERALEGHERPFTFERAPAPARELALLVLVDQSGSMGDRSSPDSRLSHAATAAMLLERAAELAGIRFGVWGFTTYPTIHRPLSVGVSDEARRRIAGMDGGGSTELAPTFRQAVAALAACPVKEHRLLVVLHDGDLLTSDAALVRAQVETLPRLRILLQPVFIGDDAQAVKDNRAVFGRVLACPQVADLAALLGAWLRATLG